MSVFVVQGGSGDIRVSRSVPTASQALRLRRQLLDEATNVEVLGVDGRSISISDLQMLADADAAKTPYPNAWIIDQTKRLAALADCQIVDSQPDYQFDQIARRAAALCDAPIALVSLVFDDRQWFRAKVGFALSETSIAQSVCKYALDYTGVLTISDLSADRRTAENELVTEAPHIRFYAGAKIEAPDHTPIGAVCVIDTVPRTGLRPGQARALELLAYECNSVLAKRG